MRLFNTMFLLLFVYIIAALLFWGFSLHKQSERIYNQELTHLRSFNDSTLHPEKFSERKSYLENMRMRRSRQYIGEGSSFILVIFIGAAVVWTSFRRSIRLSRQQNNFMLSVTHELKSPIAAVKLNLQTLEKYQLEEEQKNTLLTKSIQEASRLNDLCNNMLLASQMEGRQYKSVKEKLSFTELVERAFKDYDNRYPGRFEAEITNEENLLFGDRIMLQMAVNNLLENAVKYASSEQPVVVKLFEKNKQTCLQVKDNGIGIPDHEKQKIFRKFYRVGNENTRRSKGTGLGLYLARKIIRSHKGKISVKDNKPNGACFEVQLPVM